MSCPNLAPIGYDSLETLLVLPNRSHVSAFKRTDVDLSIDAGLVVGRNREVPQHTACCLPTESQTCC
jgi:hypothetical protein